MIPANIRFKFYPTPHDVQLENKFAVIPLELPLTKDMNSAYPKVSSVTSMLRSSMRMVYATYAITFWSNLLMPRFVPRKVCEDVSNKYTISFSNTPGPIKPFYYNNA